MALQSYSIVRLHKTFLFPFVTFFYLLFSGRIFCAWRNNPLALYSSQLLAGYGLELWAGRFFGYRLGVRRGRLVAEECDGEVPSRFAIIKNLLLLPTHAMYSLS